MSAEMTDCEFAVAGGRFLSRKFGLDRAEAETLLAHPEQADIIKRICAWADKYGASTNSPLARGLLLEALK